MFSSGILLAAQADAGDSKTLVILISNEMPDEKHDTGSIQADYFLFARPTHFEQTLKKRGSIRDKKTKLLK